jgi:anti-sigma factor RsiW
MNLENHARAKKLLHAARVEGISTGDRQWLDAHLADCAECSKEAASVSIAVDSLRALSVSAPAAVVRRTSLAVHQRAVERRSKQETAAPLWIAAATSSVWTLLTTPLVWAAFAWFGTLIHVPDTVWQIVFLMWWFMPASVVAAVAGWRHVTKRGAALNWGA